METSLHSTNLTEDELDALATTTDAANAHHIHLPGPSLWPILLNVAIIVTIAGLLFIPANPWISIIAAPFVLIGILGWALEDPMAPQYDESTNINPNLSSQDVLDMAQAIVEHTVTVSSTAYSVHPVTVEIDAVEGEMVTLALYGKVELETQRETVEAELRKLPNITDVRNYIVAEDTIQLAAEARLDSLMAKGKLDSSSNITVLVENYILHLYGDVTSKETRAMLEREMLGLPGVRVVVNHIGLNKDIPGNLGRTRNK